MVETIRKAFAHTGFAVVNVLQPCVTFDKKSTYQYYMQHVYKLDTTYNAANRMIALEKAFEVEEEKYPLGVIYQSPRKAYHEEAISDVALSVLAQSRFLDFDSIAQEFV